MVYFFLALSSLLLVAQSVAWTTRLPVESVTQRALVELSVLLWATASTIGVAVADLDDLLDRMTPT